MVGLTTTEPPWPGGPGWEHGEQELPVLKGRVWLQKMAPQPLVSTCPHLSRPWELRGEGGGA